MTITYQLQWVASDGTVLSFDETNGMQAQTGITGLDAPPVDLNMEPATSDDGSVLVRRRTTSRRVMIPLLVESDANVRIAIAQLADKLRGPGRLLVSDGVRWRELRNVYYETGLQGDEGAAVALPGVWRKPTVSLVALDPYWYDVAPSKTATLSFGSTDSDDPTVDSDDPDTPSDGGVLTTVNVVGHAEVHPVWTITGPATSLSIESGGTTAALAAALGDGTQVVLDTRDGSAYGPSLGTSGRIDWSVLTAASGLPRLATGSTAVTVNAVGTGGNTAVTASYEPRWLTP